MGKIEPSIFTGKSIKNGGSLGRREATGRGGVIVLAAVLSKYGLLKNRDLTFAVQGFGNVGKYFALSARELYPRWRLVGASDSRGGIVNPSGLDVLKLAKIKEDGKQLNTADGCPVSSGDFLSQNVDVLVLAAMENSLNRQNMSRVKAKYILELANHPLSEEAYDYLTSKNVIVIPDILANAGGVIVSYLEWLQNRRDEAWPKNKVNRELSNYLQKAASSILDYADQHQLPLKEAAFSLAICRILKARKEGINAAKT